MDILIVDDEPLARQRLARMVEAIDGYQVVAQADSAQTAMTAINEHDPDCVLLDIRMPGGDGLEAARRIGQLDAPPAVIFCTAHDEYALDAFGTEAVGYLLKPVRREQLVETLERAQRPNKLQRASVQNGEDSTHRYITAKTHRGVERIPLEEVRVFIADQKYVTVHHARGEHLLDDTLKELEAEFSDRLLRIHRNALVSVSHIEAMERNAQGQYELRLADTEHRPQVSRRHTSELKALLQRR